MIITWVQIGQWFIGVLATTLGNIITFLIFTSITSTGWFKKLLAKLSQDFDDIKILKEQLRNKK